MSPIGRVFIVLNLALAGGFAMFSGTYLQKQHTYKQKWEDSEKSKKEEVDALSKTLDEERNKSNLLEVQKQESSTQLLAAQNENARLSDDNSQLKKTTSAQEADLKELRTLAEANNTATKSAMEDARKAYEASIAYGKEKDEAVRAKDTAEAENRTLKNSIASLNSTVEERDAAIADLKRDNSEQKLLVAAAIANGFSPAMAAPALAGTVTNVSGRLCTISIADNPGDVDIQDQINRRPFALAIYDAAGGYKGDAVATKYEASANAVLCNINFTVDAATIRTGDRASTKP